MHEGKGKVWYAIPPYHRAKFEKVAKKKRADLAKDDPNFLMNSNSMIDPRYLIENGIDVYTTWQKPGEFILTFPESYHAGFSAGYNIGEAVTFTAPSWLNHVDKAMKIYLKSREKVPVFPVQWLAVENARKWNSGLKFSPDGAKKLFEFIKTQIKAELKIRQITENEFKKTRKSREYKVNLILTKLLYRQKLT